MDLLMRLDGGRRVVCKRGRFVVLGRVRDSYSAQGGRVIERNGFFDNRYISKCSWPLWMKFSRLIIKSNSFNLYIYHGLSESQIQNQFPQLTNPSINQSIAILFGPPIMKYLSLAAASVLASAATA